MSARAVPAQTDATMHRVVASMFGTLQHEMMQRTEQMESQEQMVDVERRQYKEYAFSLEDAFERTKEEDLKSRKPWYAENDEFTAGEGQAAE